MSGVKGSNNSYHAEIAKTEGSFSGMSCFESGVHIHSPFIKNDDRNEAVVAVYLGPRIRSKRLPKQH